MFRARAVDGDVGRECCCRWWVGGRRSGGSGGVEDVEKEVTVFYADHGGWDEGFACIAAYLPIV